MSIILSKRLLDVKAAAEYLSISRTTLYYLLRIKKIRSIQIRTKRLFAVEDLDLFVEQIKAEQQESICNGT